MQQTCDECGETLFGVVNRCWKCGADVKVVVTPKIPPIRRSPVELRPRLSQANRLDSAATLQDPSGMVGDVLENVKQVLPWFLNLELSEQAQERCGAVSVGLGVLGCLLGIATGWSILFGIVGLAVGLLGMTAKRRDLATMGLVVSVIAMFLGFAQIANYIWVEYSTDKWFDAGMPL